MRGHAIVRFGQPLEPIELNSRPLGHDETLVRITGCGMCHSDLHVQDGQFDMGPDAPPVQMAETILPLVPGHEIEGVIADMGEGAAASRPDLRPGMRVCVYPWLGCQTCAVCKAGEQHLCNSSTAIGIAADGGFADHVRVPVADALIACDDLAPGVGGLAMCSGLTAYSAVRKLDRVKQGEAILLIGLGGVGLAGLAMARALHDGPIIAADVSAAARAIALERGADAAVDPTDRKAFAALPIKYVIGGAIDFVGSPGTLGFGMQRVRKGGKMIVVGLFGGALQLSIPLLPLKALTLSGSYVGSLSEARELIGLIRDGKIPPPLMTLRPLDEANAALAQMRAGGHVGRTVLCP